MALTDWEKQKDFAKTGGFDKYGSYENYLNGTPLKTVQPPKMMIGDSFQIGDAYKAYTNSKGGYQDRSNALLQQVESRLSQPTTPYQQYNYQTDPLYQNALQAAQQGALLQQGNTLAKLRAGGQGKSSYSEGVANQIGQQAVADVNARTLPTLAAQHYQRYLDEQNLERQNALDLLGVGREYNNMYQQGLDNTFRQTQADRDNEYRTGQAAEQRKQNNLEAALRVGQQTGRLLQPKDDYSLLYNQDDAPLNLQGQQYQDQQKQLEDEKTYRQQRDTEEDSRWWANYERQGKEFAAQQGLQWANLSQRQKEFVADEAWKKKEFGLKEEEMKARTDPNNLENRYKEAQIKNIESQVKDRGTESTGIDEYDLLTVNSLAKQAGINPQTAKPEEIKSFVANLKGQHGWSLDEAKQVESYLNDQRTTYEQQVAEKKANEKPKPFGYRMLGG